jgi:small-conductance mechanosensitive channel
MGNEKYLNYYVEILTNTLTDAVIRNVSLQANARVTEDVIKDQIKRNEDLVNQINNLNTDSIDKVNNLNDEIKELKNYNQQSENSIINDLNNKVKGHLDTINNLTNQLAELNKMKGEYENIKHQATHVDTFRNELLKEREEHQKTCNDYENNICDLNNSFQLQIKELNEKIEYLQLTPAKRKKLEDKKNKVVEVLGESSVLPLVDETIKDGGSF